MRTAYGGRGAKFIHITGAGCFDYGKGGGCAEYVDGCFVGAFSVWAFGGVLGAAAAGYDAE
ncbi:hypothetical protein GCM10009715_41960 [Paeniglutamicibacter psychrophenolicus]